MTFEERRKEWSRWNLIETAGLHGFEFKDGSKPFAHQIEDAEQMLRDGRILLASEMGTGKTRSVLLACLEIQRWMNLPVFVACPASLTTNWQREARIVGVRVSTFSWASIPEPMFEMFGGDFPFVLVGDEVQQIQSMKSVRTKRFLDWAKHAAAVFAVSGTPTRNGRARELFPILRALGHEIADRSTDYDKRYCAGHLRKIQKKTGKTIHFWENSGATNIEELHGIMAPFTIRRLKKDCLDLPPKTRQILEIEPSQEEAVDYRRALSRAIDDAREKAEEGGDPGTLAITALSQTRMLCSAWKVPHVVTLAQDLIGQGHSVLLFSAYIETAETIGASLRVPIFTGETTKKRRQEIVDGFQDGASKAVSFTYAGGVGLNLTRASYIILVDRPWTLADAEQAEDRAHRAGQFNPVTAIWPRMFSVDEEVDRCVLAKGALAGRLIDGEGKAKQGSLAIEVLGRLWQKHFRED